MLNYHILEGNQPAVHSPIALADCFSHLKSTGQDRCGHAGHQGTHPGRLYLGFNILALPQFFCRTPSSKLLWTPVRHRG